MSPLGLAVTVSGDIRTRGVRRGGEGRGAGSTCASPLPTRPRPLLFPFPEGSSDRAARLAPSFPSGLCRNVTSSERPLLTALRWPPPQPAPALAVLCFVARLSPDFTAFFWALCCLPLRTGATSVRSTVVPPGTQANSCSFGE